MLEMIDLDDALLRDLIAKHGPESLREDRALSEAFVKVQLLALSAATPEKQEIAVTRLMALDTYLASARSRADRDQVIEMIGGGPSNVYRLLNRIRKFGPITGLLKGTLTEPRSSVVRDGFGPLVDEWIADLLAKDAEMKIAEVARRLSERIDHHSGSKVRMPHAAALKRRIQMLRQERIGTVITDAAIGGNILIDQVMLNVQLTGAARHDPDLCSAVFIVDRNTSLILGFSVYEGSDPRAGFKAVAESATVQMQRLADQGLRFADHLEQVRWIMTSEMTEHRAILRERARMLNLPKSLVFVVRGQVSGRDLSRLVGPGVPPFEFKLRATPDDMPPEVAEQSQLTAPGRMALSTLSEVDWRLDLAVAQRNAKVIAGIRAIEAHVANTAVEGCNDNAKASTIADEIAKLIEPVIVWRRGQVAHDDAGE